MPKISERPASEDSEEGEASDGVDPSPSRDTRLVKRDPLIRVNNKTRADRTAKARKKGLEEGIEIGKQESAGKIKERDTLIKTQNSHIKQLTAELVLEAAHLLPAGQQSDLSATSISSLTADNNRQRGENAQLEQRVPPSDAANWAVSPDSPRKRKKSRLSLGKTPDCMLRLLSSPGSILRI